MTTYRIALLLLRVLRFVQSVALTLAEEWRDMRSPK
jgi:hypothetical protein